MYKRIDFTQLEGLPLTQNTLKFLQENWADAFSALAGFIGDNVIISGVADEDPNWGNGYVVINGEILPFVGGVKDDQIVIEETVAAKIFGDGDPRNVWFTRVAKSGNAGGVGFDEFVRLDSFRTLQEKTKYDTIEYVISGGGIEIVAGNQGVVRVGFNCEIIGWSLLADDDGDIEIDIWKDTFANYPPTVDDTICGTYPSISADDKAESEDMEDWTVDLTRGDILKYKVNSCEDIKEVTVTLHVIKKA